MGRKKWKRKPWSPGPSDFRRLNRRLNSLGLSALPRILGGAIKNRVGLYNLGQDTGLARQSLYRILRYGRGSNLDSVDRILRALGLRLVLESRLRAPLRSKLSSRHRSKSLRKRRKSRSRS